MGRNLCAQLNNIKDGKARNYGPLTIDEVFEYDLDSTPEQLDQWCAEADFVFNLAGVNRPQNQKEFMAGNFGFASTLLDTLKKHGNRCPIMLSSSQQASLTGRFGNSEYGRSKKAGEDLFLQYERDFLKADQGIPDQVRNEGTGVRSEVDQVRDEGTGARNEGDQVRNEGTGVRNEGLRPRVLVYRFPNLFGKWCRPNYNSAVATFCNAIANDLPYTVNDPSVELELLYIDDLVDEMIACLKGEEHRCEFDGLEVIPKGEGVPDQVRNEGTGVRNEGPGVRNEGTGVRNEGLIAASEPQSPGRYCYVPTTHKATLGEIVELLKSFAEQPKTLMIPEIPSNSFAKKLYSTYLSYLPKEKVAFTVEMKVDDRGSFTELVHTHNCGQVSVNISKPGVTKGQHWHNTKWEFFIVVAGHGLIQERKVGTDEVIEFEVSGDNIQCVHMLPGYTHNIINLSQTENLVTVMYANEIFNPDKPDTFFEPV